MKKLLFSISVTLFFTLSLGLTYMTYSHANPISMATMPNRYELLGRAGNYFVYHDANPYVCAMALETLSDHTGTITFSCIESSHYYILDSAHLIPIREAVDKGLVTVKELKTVFNRGIN